MRIRPVLVLFLIPLSTFVFGQTINNPGASNWQDIPGSLHGGACGFSFADGHSEIHKWHDKRTQPPVKRAGYNAGSQSNNQDVGWLWNHTTQKM